MTLPLNSRPGPGVRGGPRGPCDDQSGATGGIDPSANRSVSGSGPGVPPNRLPPGTICADLDTPEGAEMLKEMAEAMHAQCRPLQIHLSQVHGPESWDLDGVQMKNCPKKGGTMDRETIVRNIGLLKKSIVHWHSVKLGLEPGDSAACPLCKEFLCGDCPIKGKTGKQGCRGTPFSAWASHHTEHHKPPAMAVCDLCRDLAQDEIDFIGGVLEKWEAKLVAFDEKAKEVYVWLLRDGEVEKVKVDYPDFMEACLKTTQETGGKYVLFSTPRIAVYAKDENVTWFWSEKAAIAALAKPQEVNVWLLKDGKVEKVRVDGPDSMERALSGCGVYQLSTFDCIYAKDENVTWFRTEEAAKKKVAWRAAVKWDAERMLAKGRAKEAETAKDKMTFAWVGKVEEGLAPSGDLISLDKAVAAVREAASRKVGEGWRDFTPKMLATSTVEIAVSNIRRLPTNPVQGKMVPWKRVEDIIEEFTTEVSPNERPIRALRYAVDRLKARLGID